MKVYLDNSATTKIDKEVLNKMIDFEREFFGNPSSVHYEGQRAKIELENAREEIATFLECKAQELIFTSSGTEANNLAILGILKKGDHAICSSIEHSSNLNAYKYLKNMGVEVSFLPTNTNGIVEIDNIEEIIKENTVLISLMHANNEIGTIQPIKDVKKIIEKRNILLHVDAVQTIGKLEDNPIKFADLCTFTAHKIYGPKGVGGLYLRNNTKINKLIFGGEQEWNKRAGTENLRAIVGLKEALKLSFKYFKEYYEKVKNLRDHFEMRLINEVEDCEINGDKERRVVGISNIFFKDIRHDILLFKLDMQGIYASAGSACASGSIEPSHVLKALGFSDERQKSSIRFSLGKYNNLREINYSVDKIKNIVSEIRRK